MVIELDETIEFGKWLPSQELYRVTKVTELGALSSQGLIELEAYRVSQKKKKKEFFGGKI